MKITYNFADRAPITTQPHPWAHVTRSLGVHWFERFSPTRGGTLRLTNGVANADQAGTATLQYIDVQADYPICWLPRTCIVRTGPNSCRITVPGDLICMPGRSSWRLDLQEGATWTNPGFNDARILIGDLDCRLPDSFVNRWAYGGSWVAALASGLRPAGAPDGNEMQTGSLGIFQPLGNRISNEGGGNQVSPLPHAPDGITVLLRHRLTMERMWIDCLDKATGEPLLAPALRDDGYGLEGTTTRHATLPAFHDAPHPPWESNLAIPHRMNAGQATHEANLMGFHYTADNGWETWAGGYQTHDGQHRIRALPPTMACAQLLQDECAEFDLRMMLQDARYAHSQPIPFVPGGGSGYYGTREVVWCGWAGMTNIALYSAAAQMANGCVMNAGYSLTTGFNPSPWPPASGAVPNPLDPSYHAGSGMENDFAGILFWTQNACRRAALRTLDEIYLRRGSIVRRQGMRPKWFAVAQDTQNLAGSPMTKFLRHIDIAAGEPDYFSHAFVGFCGLAARTDAERARAVEAICLLPWGERGRPRDAVEALAWFTAQDSDAYARRFQTPAAVSFLETLQ